MKIFGLNTYQPIFKAHSYEVEHKNSRIVIKTDNEKKLGNEPYLVYHSTYGDEQVKMNKKGELYSASVYTMKPDFKYHILYKDTGKIDLKNGKEYQINPIKMMQKAAHKSRIMHRQPTIFTIKEGKTIGKVVYNNTGYEESDKLSDIDEPTILITPHFSNNASNPNVVGIVYTAYDCGAFDHITARLRQQTNVCAAVFKPEIIDKLASMDGKNIELEVKDGNINFRQTNKRSNPMVYPEIDIPKLKYSNQVLTSKEYKPDIVGTKAVNLRRLEKLKEQGKIDINVPKSMALPYGYIQEMFGENPIQEEYYNDPKFHYLNKENAYIPYKDEYCKERMDNLRNILFDNGIIESDDDIIMVRSSFNGEDLPNYSAAGIYSSYMSDVDNKHLYNNIVRVAQSKWDENAVFAREMHNIPEENIQYCVLLQQRIDPDYKFTLYTDDENGNLKIDLFSGESIYDNSTNPHIFTYNKKTGKLTYNSIQLSNPTASFNENQKLQSIEPAKDNLSNNKKLFEQIKKVAQNAIIVEKEFGAPQDIEGGIKDGNIYFWQSRNIVK